MLANLPVPGRPTDLITVGQGGAGEGCLDIFTLIYPFFPPPPFLWETVRYRLKYCLKGPLNPKQPTNQRQPGEQCNEVLNYVVQVGGGRVVRWSWINFQVRGVLLVWIRVGQGPAALAVGSGRGCLDVFALVCPFSFLSPSL